MYKRLCIFILTTLLVACSPGKKHDELYKSVDNWAELMANSVMTRHDSLINYNNSEVRWQFDNAMLGQAIDKLGNKDQKYSQYLTEFVDYFVQDDGSVNNYNQNEYFLDHINPAKNIITLYKRTGEEKYYTALQTFIEQLKNQPRTNSGGFWHKNIYPHQMWINGLYMYAPFMAQYAREFNAPELFDEASRQLIHMYNQTVDTTAGLLYHAWDESKTQRWGDHETGLSKFFWGRGMGWYMMALVDVLDYLPKNHPDKEKLIILLNDLSAAILKYQDKNTKLWYHLLNLAGKEGNFLEPSCSGMFIYTFAKGANKGYLPKKYITVANESFDALIEKFIVFEDKNLITMKNVCGAVGLGGNPYREGDYNYYTNVEIVDNDAKGVAPFVLAAIELNK